MNPLRAFFKHFAHPHGFWGRIVAYRLDLSNRQVNLWTVEQLELQPNDRVLEVGFGSGLTLQTTFAALPHGFVAGVDPSGTMLELAQKRNTKAIASGRMVLQSGCMESLPFPDNDFDKAYAVQVINYLTDPLEGVKELRRVLRPGGRLALFFEAKEKFEKVQGLIEGIYRPYAPGEVLSLLEQAGFGRAWVERKDFIIRNIRYTGLVALGEK